MDYRITQCQALFDWYARKGLPDDVQVAIDAVTTLLTGEPQDEATVSTEDRLEALEVAFNKWLGAQEPPETSAPQRPSLRSNRYADFLQSLHNLTLNLEQVGGEVKADKIAEALDQMIVDFYEGDPHVQGDV